jgi:hypothetical protein
VNSFSKVLHGSIPLCDQKVMLTGQRRSDQREYVFRSRDFERCRRWLEDPHGALVELGYAFEQHLLAGQKPACLYKVISLCCIHDDQFMPEQCEQ